MTLTQETNYPWDGTVRISVEVDGTVNCGINVRLPGWCNNVHITVNSEVLDIEAVGRKGYAHIDREWQSGDVIEVDLSMPVERVYANASVRMANGKVALQRGPIVYCLEETDNKISLHNDDSRPRSATIRSHNQHQLLCSAPTLHRK